MRLLIVSNFFPPYIVGGAEIVAHRHALAMKRRGHHVAVFAGRAPAATDHPGQLDIECVDGLPVYRLGLLSLSPQENFHCSSAARRFQAVVHAEKPDVIHFHNVAGLGANLIPEACQLGVRTIVTLHDHWGFCYKNTRLKTDAVVCSHFHDCYQCLTHYCTDDGVDLPIRMRRDYVSWCLDVADRLVSPSEYLSRVYGEARVGRVPVIVRSNGIDLDRFATVDRKASKFVRFTVIGYLGEHKGLPLLMKAVDSLLRRDELRGLWKLRIAGDGHLKEWLTREIDRLGCGDHVEFLGKVPRDKIVDVFEETDVVLLASVWPENEPVVLLEAIAAGCAQLASGHGGNVELVAEGKGGLLFRPGCPTALEAGMVRLIEEPSIAAHFGAQNWANRAAFDETTSCDGYEKDYELLSYQPQSQFKGQKAPVVICAGGWPPLSTARIVNTFATLRPDMPDLRFIWEGYANPLAWEQAAAVWLWADRPADNVIRQAMYRGIPVISSSHHYQAKALREIGGYAITYADATEAVSALAIVVRERNNITKLMSGSTRVGDMIATIADKATFVTQYDRP